LKKLNVKIKKVLYYKNGWGIFGCIPITQSEGAPVVLNDFKNFTIKGNTLELFEGNTYDIEIEDEAEKSDRGDSYNIIKVHVPKITSSKAQYDFLKNLIATSHYNAIVEVYPPKSGLKILDAIKGNEIDLTKAKGIQTKTAEKIRGIVVEKEEYIYIYNKLIPLGVSENMIDVIVNHYDTMERTIYKIDDSLYNLCEVKGLGFKKVDGYALAGGEDKEGFKRMEACLNYLIHEYATEGHSWTSYEEIKEKAVELLDIDGYNLDVYLSSLDTVGYTNLMNVHDGQITSKYYYRIEKELYEDLKRLDDTYKVQADSKILNEAISKAQTELGITYTEEQLSVIKESFEHGVYIINGKGGVGKSLLMKGVTEACDALGLDYQAIALSGRAAQLLTLKGINASTIHRLLGYSGGRFVHNSEFKLSQDVIILEEASMVNAQLWHSIVTAMKDGSKLIIVGDSGQLSGIGNGDVLRDLLVNPKFNGRELMQIHRQAQDSGIIEVAGNIRNGENVTGYNWELSNSYGVNSDLFIFTYNDKNDLLNNAENIIKKRMMELDETSVLDFQIIVSNKARGDLSTVSINKYCQRIYNNLDKPFVKNHTHEFRIGDKVINSGNKYSVHMYQSVMHYKNDEPNMIYDAEEGDYVPEKYSLYNGTIGIVVDINTDKGKESVLVKYEGMDGYIRMGAKELPDLDLAYALTVHKCQGMSIRNVLVLLDFGAFKLLSKQLVYTGITRASDKCVLLAENNALMKACNVDNSSLRRTFVGQFIQMENK